MLSKGVKYKQIEEETGISYGRITRAHERKQQGKPVLGQRGRPSILTDDDIAELKSQVAKYDNYGNALTTSQLNTLIINAIKQRRISDGMSPTDSELKKVGPQFLARFTKKHFKLHANGGSNTRTRALACMNIRNFISLAAVLYAIFFPNFDNKFDPTKEDIAAFNVCNMDATQLVLTSNTVTVEKLVTNIKTKEEKRQKRASGKNTKSLNGDNCSNYPRVNFLGYANAAGDLGTPIFIIKDKKSTLSEVTAIKLPNFMGARAAWLYILPPKCENAEFYKMIYEFHVFPDMDRVHADRTKDMADGTASKRKVFILDGEAAQLKGLDLVVKRALESLIELLKSAAACTSVQQAMDVMACFRSLKNCLSRLVWKYDNRWETDSNMDVNKPYMKPLMDGVEKHIKLHKTSASLTSARRRILYQFMYQAPLMLDEAYKKRHIHEGFRKTGVYPYSMETILATCTSWENTPTNLQKVIRAVTREAALKCCIIGEVSEHFLDAKKMPGGKEETERDYEKWLHPVVDLTYDESGDKMKPTLVKKRKRPDMENRQLSHRRAVWINQKGWVLKNRSPHLKAFFVKRVRECIGPAFNVWKNALMTVKREEHQAHMARMRLEKDMKEASAVEKANLVKMRAKKFAKMEKACRLLVEGGICGFCHDTLRGRKGIGWNGCDSGCSLWYCDVCCNLGAMVMHEKVCKGPSNIQQALNSSK